MSSMILIHQHRVAWLAVQVLALLSVFHFALAANTWDGGGANDQWGTPANWDENLVPGFPAALTFAGTKRLTPNNDLSGVTVNGLTFDAGAEAFTLGGNPPSRKAGFVKADLHLYAGVHIVSAVVISLL